MAASTAVASFVAGKRTSESAHESAIAASTTAAVFPLVLGTTSAVATARMATLLFWRAAVAPLTLLLLFALLLRLLLGLLARFLGLLVFVIGIVVAIIVRVLLLVTFLFLLAALYAAV
jgi:hypothetical protein